MQYIEEALDMTLVIQVVIIFTLCVNVIWYGPQVCEA